MKKKYNVFALISLSLFFFTVEWGWATSAVNELAVPCRQKETDPKFLRSCQDVIEGKVNGKTETDKIPGVLAQLDQQLKTDIELGYGFVKCKDEKGEKYDCPAPNGPGFYDYSAGVENIKVYHFAEKTCSLFPNFFNDQQSEKTKNHHGQLCGDPVCTYVDVEPEYVLGVCVGVTVHRSLYLGSRSPNEKYCIDKGKGELERAYFAGALIQAFDYFRREVRNEISENKKIKISSNCSEAARAVYDLSQQANQQSVSMSASLKKDVGSRANIADIINCEKGFERNSTENSVGMDVGNFRQSAQHLCAARGALESSFIQLARCEVATRAGKAFRKTFKTLNDFALELRSEEGSGPQGSECKNKCNPEEDSQSKCESKLNQCAAEFADPRTSSIQSPAQICNDEVEHKCRSCGGATRCATTHANSCYLRELPRFVKAKSEIWKTE